MLSAFMSSDDACQRAVLFCDVDDFKRVNDALGHEAGDELLRTLASRLQAYLPSVCTAARLSGDEFLVLCWDTREAGGLEKLTTDVSALMCTTFTKRGTEMTVSVSIGTATIDTATDGGDLLRTADIGMLEAKFRREDRRS